jgi:uncharacterized protein YdeI (YjbR/CyaY-like superfamily)
VLVVKASTNMFHRRSKWPPKVMISISLSAALAQNEPARDAYEVLSKTDRYAVILRLLKARTPDNRAAQLQKAVTSLENGSRV